MRSGLQGGGSCRESALERRTWAQALVAESRRIAHGAGALRVERACALRPSCAPFVQHLCAGEHGPWAGARSGQQASHRELGGRGSRALGHERLWCWGWLSGMLWFMPWGPCGSTRFSKPTTALAVGVAGMEASQGGLQGAHEDWA